MRNGVAGIYDENLLHSTNLLHSMWQVPATLCGRYLTCCTLCGRDLRRKPAALYLGARHARGRLRPRGVGVRGCGLGEGFYFSGCTMVALPTETKVESGTSQSKSGTSVNLSSSGNHDEPWRPCWHPYRLTSLIRNCLLLGPYSRPILRDLRCSLGGGSFL